MFKECRHILSSGRRCHAAALRGKDWCYFHEKLHRLTHPRTGEHVGPIAMPLIEDDSSLKLALANAIASLTSPYAANSLYRDPRRAGLMLYALQIASQVIARSAKSVETETVRDVSSDENGPDLAPEKTTCEPPADCINCRRRTFCPNFKLYRNKVKELEERLEAEREANQEAEREREEAEREREEAEREREEAEEKQDNEE